MEYNVNQGIGNIQNNQILANQIINNALPWENQEQIEKNIIKENCKEPDKGMFNKFIENGYDKVSDSVCKSKNTFIKGLPSELERYSKNYDIYFTTLTFCMTETRTSVAYEEYEDYIETIKGKLTEAMFPRRVKIDEVPLFLFFLEKSNPHTPHHLHGFMIIHKNRSANFIKYCVSEIKQEQIKSLGNESRDSYILNDFVLNSNNRIVPKSPTTQAKYEKRRELELSGKIELSKLVVFEYRIYAISTPEDFQKTSRYSSKSYLFNGFDYIWR